MQVVLHELIEDYFRPKWWQFWHRQKFHVCNKGDNWGSTWQIYEVRPKLCILEQKHYSGPVAGVEADRVIPRKDGWDPIFASDPEFFKKLDHYLNHGEFGDLRNNWEKKAYAVPSVSASQAGPAVP